MILNFKKSRPNFSKTFKGFGGGHLTTFIISGLVNQQSWTMQDNRTCSSGWPHFLVLPQISSLHIYVDVVHI